MLARLLVVVLLGPGCGDSDEERPPPLSGRIEPHPLACSEIQTASLQEDGSLMIDGMPAACAAQGLECPLLALNGCEPGQILVAHCLLRIWTGRCSGATD